MIHCMPTPSASGCCEQELKEHCDLSTDTLRHNERKGPLQAGRSANGYREYAPQSQDRIRLVRNALSVGFTLDELGRLLKIREEGGAPCRKVRALAGAKLKDLEEQPRGLSALRDELRMMLGQWDAKLVATRKAGARLLDGDRGAAVVRPSELTGNSRARKGIISVVFASLALLRIALEGVA